MRSKAIFVSVFSVLFFASCGGDKRGLNILSPTPVAQPGPTPPDPNPTPNPTPPLPPIVTVPTFTFIGAGDIGWCGIPGASLTGSLLGRLLGKYERAFTFALGDNAYPIGSERNYRDCFAPYWGAFRDRMYPTPGNHDYETPNAAGYFSYFGSRAGREGLEYYSFQLGAWHALSLNSETITDPSKGPAQLAWLETELRFNPSQCQIAYWHKPLFSSGVNGDNPQVKRFWDILARYGVEVVLNGHDHIYERFAPQTPEGVLDPNGIRQFTVGTGGAELTNIRPTSRQTSQVRISKEYGLLVLTLADGSYRWEFTNTNDRVRDDSTQEKDGRVLCHQ